MNTHQLLSVSQSSPQTQSQGAFRREGSANGLFHQTLLQASDAQRLSASALNETSASGVPGRNALGFLVSDALEVDVQNLNEVLQSLGLDISENDLSELLAQLQLTSSGISADTLALSGGETSTPLDEIASRLALIASFSDGQTSLKEEQLTNFDSLKSITEMLNIGSNEPATPIDPAALEAIAEQLNINQTEASQLVAALNVLVSQQQSAQSLPIDSARLARARSAAIEVQATHRQPDTLFAQMNSGSAVSQISSEALMGALLTVEGSSKGNLASEQLLTGLSLNSGNNPLASSQALQGFAPTAAPTAATLSTPITNPAWPQQLSQQLVQISQRGGEQHVQMQLNPAELGPLSISLKFSEQGAQAHFLSAHAQVRQVLEQAIPQLREALAEQGISLGETSVGEQRDPNAQAFAQSGGKQGPEAGSENGDIGSDDSNAQSAGSSSLIMDGRVDLYA